MTIHVVDNSSKLNEIIKNATQTTKQNLRTLAVFDLDSTLFNVSTRTQKILHEFADLHNLEDLKNTEVLLTDWGVREAVIRQGYKIETHSEILEKLRDFWFERFFSNEYLHYDVPYIGAIEFVLEMEAAGVEIMYLTGRDQARMGIGTKQVLQKWGFPVEDHKLFLKPNRTMDDELYKKEWFERLDRSAYNQVYFFENEPVNVNAILQHCPDVEVIFLDTTHARKQTVTADIHRIKNFRR
ncbi:MAG: HAD family hydrolase [Bdellovibrio sp.]|nr:HAD family hydrolase [Bdellovibrio sp.]